MKPRWLIIPLLVLLLMAGVFILRPGEPEGRPAPLADSGAPAPDIRDFNRFDPVPGPRTQPDPDVSVPLPESTADAIPGEYTLSFSDPAAMQAFLDEADARGIRILGTIPELLTVRFSAHPQQVARLAREGLELDSNIRVQVPLLPNPDFWAGTPLRGFRSEALDFLGVPEGSDRLAWGEGVTIAVLDTGWSGHAAVDPDRVRQIDLLDGSLEGDASPHGNAVAGLIASQHPMAPGIAPGSDILAIRVLDGSGQGNAFTLAEGIIAAVENGAGVINMSLGSYGSSDVLYRAVQYAEVSGVVMIAAVGNDGIGAVTIPAAYPEVIGVSAVDANGNRLPFANFGEGTDVGAPGYQVNAIWQDEQIVSLDGTSGAAAFVSGMAARIYQTGSASTPAEARQLIRDQANDTGPPGDDLQYGGGILNADRIESVGESGIFDIAIADLYPAAEESDGTSFPLYVSLENRGTERLPESSVEITVNGTQMFYRISGLEPGDVQSVSIPVLEAGLDGGQRYVVTAVADLPERTDDGRPANNGGQVTLSRMPGN